MSNYNYGITMNGSGYDQMSIPYSNYKFISVINNTDNIIEVYQEKRATTELAALLIKIPPYTALTVPIDNRADFSFIYTDGGGASPKRAQVIFSTENLMYSGALGTVISGSVTIGADGVGLAKQAQLPAALGGSGGLKVEVLSAPAGSSNTTIVADSVGLAKQAQLPAALGASGGMKTEPQAVLVVGAHANTANAQAIGAGGTTTAIDTQYTKQLSIFGNVSGATTLTVQVSQNNANWYDTGSTQAPAGASDFAFLALSVGARYVRLKSSAAITITATVAGKQ